MADNGKLVQLLRPSRRGQCRDRGTVACSGMAEQKPSPQPGRWTTVPGFSCASAFVLICRGGGGSRVCLEAQLEACTTHQPW